MENEVNVKTAKFNWSTAICLVIIVVLLWVFFFPKHKPSFEYKTPQQVSQMDAYQSYSYLIDLKVEKQRIFDNLNGVQTVAYYNGDNSMFSWIDDRIEAVRIQKDKAEEKLGITYDKLKPVEKVVEQTVVDTPSTELNKALNLK